MVQFQHVVNVELYSMYNPLIGGICLRWPRGEDLIA